MLAFPKRDFYFPEFREITQNFISTFGVIMYSWDKYGFENKHRQLNTRRPLNILILLEP